MYVRFSFSFWVDMVHYCCVLDCKNNSTVRDFSFHGFPKDKKLIKVRNSLLSSSRTITSCVCVCSVCSVLFFFRCCFKVWISRIRRDPKKDFRVTKSTKVCSEHFTLKDFISTSGQKKRLTKLKALLRPCFRGLQKVKKGTYLQRD